MPLSNLSSEIAILLEGQKSGLVAACVPEGALLAPLDRVKVKLHAKQAKKIRIIPAVDDDGELHAWFARQAADMTETTMLLVGHAKSGNQALKVLLAARQFAQSEPSRSPCTVVVGAWNVVHVRNEWPAQGSPFETHHIEFCEGLTPSAMESLFDRNQPDHPLERAAFIELIREETGGQEWLCRDLLQKLTGTIHRQDIAIVLRHLHAAPSVVYEVGRRLSCLSLSQTQLLNQLLDRRSLQIDSHECKSDAVELWLRGFARFRDAPHHALLHGNPFHLSPPVPVIERCLRPKSQLMLAVPAISAAILPLLFQIENALRDLVSGEMALTFGPDWKQHAFNRISAIRSVSGNVPLEAREIVAAVLSELGLSKEASVCEEVAFSQKVRLFDVVEKAKAQLQQSHSDPTTGISDLCFLNLVQLTALLTNPAWFNKCFRPIFKLEAAQLRGKLDELRQIRNAVAHCYPLRFSELGRTRTLVQELLDRMAFKVSGVGGVSSE